MGHYYKDYKVVYEADVYAVSPEEAALEAYRTMMDPAGTPPILGVTGPDGVEHLVDVEKLMGEGE